jgi:hypothetical protein
MDFLVILWQDSLQQWCKIIPLVCTNKFNGQLMLQLQLPILTNLSYPWNPPQEEHKIGHATIFQKIVEECAFIN